MITDIIVLSAVALIFGSIIYYLVRQKKKGVKCIGCPSGAKCSGNCSGCSGACGGCKR